MGRRAHALQRAALWPQWPCMPPPAPAVTRAEGIRRNAITAITAAIPAAAMKPRENPAATPSTLTRLPAVAATADSTATPRAAPTSWPVIRKPDAVPACWAGIPAIDVTDTGTKTMPDAEAENDQARQEIGAVARRGRCPREQGCGHTRRGSVRSSRGPGVTAWASRWRATWVPAVTAKANGRNATPAASAE